MSITIHTQQVALLMSMLTLPLPKTTNTNKSSRNILFVLIPTDESIFAQPALWLKVVSETSIVDLSTLKATREYKCISLFAPPFNLFVIGLPPVRNF